MELQEAELERTKADMLQIHASVFVVNRKKMANWTNQSNAMMFKINQTRITGR